MLYRIQSTALGQSGNTLLILPGASVTVLGSTGALARLYADPDEVTELPNPTLADTSGGYDVYVAYDDYFDVSVSLNGQTVDDRIYPIEVGLGARVEAAATDATAQAVIATTQAGISTAQAVISTAQAGIATTQAGIATTKAGEASTSAANAALFDGPRFATIAAAAAHTDYDPGGFAIISPTGETFQYDAASTATADGALIVTATGMAGVGRLISTRAEFDSYAEFRADLRAHAVGTMLLVRNLGWYEVVSSGGNIPGADAFADTRKALPLPWGGYSLRQFGAVGDGVTDDFDAIQYAIDASMQGGHEMFIGEGTFIIGESSESAEATLYLSNITADKQGLTMTGAGRGKTVFKEKDGKTAANGRFTKMFYCWLASAARVFNFGTFTFRDITFDKNGRSNGTPPTLYEWEGAHIISFQGVGDPDLGQVTPSVDAITIERCEFIDKVGAGFVFGPVQTVARAITVTDLQSTYHPSIAEQGGPIGQKGCIECAGDADLIVMSGVNAIYTQFEPTAVFDATREVRTSISDSRIETVEMTYIQSQGGKSNYFLQVDNLTCLTKFLTRGCFTNVTNSRIKAFSEFYDFRLSIDNSTILLPYNETTGAVTPFYTNTPTNWTLTVPRTFVSNSEFLIDYGQPIDVLPVAATGYAVRSNTQTDITRAAIQIFDNCTFDQRLAGTMDAYSTGGATTFARCKVAGSSGTPAFQAGTFSTNQNSLTLIDNDYSACANQAVKILHNATGYTLKVSGEYGVADFLYGSSNIALVLPANFPVKPTLVGTVAPTSGAWPKGQRVQNLDPDIGEAVEFVCTVSGAPGTWTNGFVLV